MIESFTNMQQLISFARKHAQGDFSYRWYGERFTEVVARNASSRHAVYSPISPENWRPTVLELVRKSKRSPRP